MGERHWPCFSNRVPETAVKLEGKATHWDKAADSDNIVTRAFFCPKCGSPVYSRNSGLPDFFFVRAGSLDDPTRYTPQMVVWTSSGFHLGSSGPRASAIREDARDGAAAVIRWLTMTCSRHVCGARWPAAMTSLRSQCSGA